MDGEVKAELERLRDEEKRQNNRIDKLEEEHSFILDLALSVKELAINSNHTSKKVEEICSRLSAIENKPIKEIEGARTTAINTVVGIIAGAVVSALAFIIFSKGGL